MIALTTFILGNSLGGLGRTTPAVFSLFGQEVVVQPSYLKVIVIVLTIIFVLAGIVATRSVGNELARVVRSRSSASAASAIRLICFVLGYAPSGWQCCPC